jgi:hypothetical protein
MADKNESEEVSKEQTGPLSTELNTELKRFLIDKPGGYQYARRFINDAVKEKMKRMKEGVD